MTITQYIEKLEEIKAEHGDLEVWQHGRNTTLGCIDYALNPKVKEIAKLKKRETNLRYMLGGSDEESTGTKIVYVGW